MSKLNWVLQLFNLLASLFISFDKQDGSKALYIKYHLKSNRSGINIMSNEEDIFIFNIGAIESKYKHDLPPIFFESQETSSQISKTKFKGQLKDIAWLKETYLKAFEYFRNDPPGLSSEGDILSFDLSKDFERIFIVEDISSDSFQITKVREIQIEDY